MIDEQNSGRNLEEQERQETAPLPTNANEQEAVIYAEEVAENESEAVSAVEPASETVTSQPPRLERLQKILAAAGVASRRHAEELITLGRVEVNGKVVTELGTKADAAHDHIRVDGKLLHGAERLRYFMLNKPKGYVTTVSDPEGRPTVMEFFKKTKERLYPVGRLDYLSEGLLVVTNDGELANRLTRAALGIEKIYLVKVAGQPSEAELERLRGGGVAIDRGRPGSEKVETAPAAIRQVRLGDNPWFEVTLIEGRNRELRKMFEQIGHHVEKIRRVGYGPLVLDLEPGHVRELDAEEIDELRKAAEGKTRKPAGTAVRRKMQGAPLPTVTPRGSEPAVGWKPGRPGSPANRTAPAGPKRPFRREEGSPMRPPRPGRKEEGRWSRGPERAAAPDRGPGRKPAGSPPPQRRTSTGARGAFTRPFEERKAGADRRGSWRGAAAPRGASPRPGAPSRKQDAQPRPAAGPGWKSKPQHGRPARPGTGGGASPQPGLRPRKQDAQPRPAAGPGWKSKPQRSRPAGPGSGSAASRPRSGGGAASRPGSFSRPARRPQGRPAGRSGERRGGPRPPERGGKGRR